MSSYLDSIWKKNLLGHIHRFQVNMNLGRTLCTPVQILSTTLFLCSLNKRHYIFILHWSPHIMSLFTVRAHVGKRGFMRQPSESVNWILELSRLTHFVAASWFQANPCERGVSTVEQRTFVSLSPDSLPRWRKEELSKAWPVILPNFASQVGHLTQPVSVNIRAGKLKVILIKFPSHGGTIRNEKGNCH